LKTSKIQSIHPIPCKVAVNESSAGMVGRLTAVGVSKQRWIWQFAENLPISQNLNQRMHEHVPIIPNVTVVSADCAL
jgi:hypothetical protein